MTDTHADVTVVIATRNRPQDIVIAVSSVLQCQSQAFELIVVDQSPDDSTTRALQTFMKDRRLHYVHSRSVGKGVAYNIALSMTTSSIAIFTDDDCSVPLDWVEQMSAAFNKDPRIGVVFCNVEPGPHDDSAGFIPAYQRKESKLISSIWEKPRARGIGAGMGVRVDMVLAIGGFDNHLGPGGKFFACIDGDLAVRALLHGWYVYETTRTTVVHYGFRTWAQGKELSRRAWTGIGAAYAKPLRCGRWEILSLLFHEAIVVALGGPFRKLVRLQKPRGIRNFVYFLQGFARGWCTPLDCYHMVYRTA